MAYSNQSDLEDACGGAERLVQLADWDRDGIPDAPRIADAIAKADALIDSLASKQFHVSFSPVPPLTSNAADAGLDAALKLAWMYLLGIDLGIGPQVADPRFVEEDEIIANNDKTIWQQTWLVWLMRDVDQLRASVQKLTGCARRSSRPATSPRRGTSWSRARCKRYSRYRPRTS